MKEKTRQISIQQLFVTVLICLLVDVIINPRTTPTAISSQGIIIGIIIEAALLAVFTMPIYWLTKNTSMHKILSGKDFKSKLFSVIMFFTIGFSAAAGIAQAENFYRFVSENLLSVWVFIALVLCVAVYGAKMGLEPLVRAGLIVAVCLAASISFIIIANISQFSLTNLQFSDNPFKQGVYAALNLFNFPTEVLIYFLFLPQVNSKTTKPFAIILPAFLIVYISIAVMQELVLGSFTALQLQPLHTLARIGSISVFTRLDAVHVSVWIMLAIFRIAIHFLAMIKLAEYFIAEKYKKIIIPFVLIIMLVLVCICLYFAFAWAKLACSIVTMLICVLMPVLFAKAGEVNAN